MFHACSLVYLRNLSQWFYLKVPWVGYGITSCFGTEVVRNGIHLYFHKSLLFFASPFCKKQLCKHRFSRSARCVRPNGLNGTQNTRNIAQRKGIYAFLYWTTKRGLVSHWSDSVISCLFSKSYIVFILSLNEWWMLWAACASHRLIRAFITHEHIRIPYLLKAPIFECQRKCD